MSTPARNWLVFRLSALGDVLLTTGVLEYLHSEYNWRFHVLTKDSFAPVFANNPAVELVLQLQEKHLRISPMLALFMQLADTYAGWGLLDLHGTLRSRLLGAIWRGPVARYPKQGFARRIFLASGRRWCKKLLDHTTVAQRYAMAVTKDSIDAGRLVPRMYLTDDERRDARKRLEETFGDAALHAADGLPHPVALHPYATHPGKAWPAEHWHALVTDMDSAGIPWIALGQGDAMFPGRAEEYSNTTSVREAAALLAECRVLVTGDSGPMHISNAVGTPVVALFGPTTREWGFYPTGEKDRVLELPLDCRPCSLHGKKDCPIHTKCLADISPETVLAHLETMYCEQR